MYLSILIVWILIVGVILKVFSAAKNQDERIKRQIKAKQRKPKETGENNT